MRYFPPKLEEMEEEEDRFTEEEENRMLNMAELDRNSIANVYVKIYYTPQVERKVGLASLKRTVNLAIQETNEGFQKSGIFIRLQLHCMERSRVNDKAKTSTMLSEFARSKSR